MKEIPLTQGMVALVDDEDFDRLNHFNWYARKSWNTFYAIRSIGYDKVYMHREVMHAPEGTLVDHQDGNGLNNQKSNLRHASHSGNTTNQRMSVRNRSGFKGVYYSRNAKKYCAMIGGRGKQRYLGYFEDAKEAARAYDQAAIQAHGEFARTNEMMGLI